MEALIFPAVLTCSFAKRAKSQAAFSFSEASILRNPFKIFSLSSTSFALKGQAPTAMIEEIKTDTAKKVLGIACILTYEDVTQERFTMAGQTYPELSPYDRLILDKHLRFVGDAVAIVAGENEKAVDKALKLIKVKYEILEPVLDFHKAKDCYNGYGISHKS